MDLSNIPTQVLLDEIEHRKQIESGHTFKIGDKVRNKITKQVDIIKSIDDKNYYFYHGMKYIIDDWDGFSFTDEEKYEKI